MPPPVPLFRGSRGGWAGIAHMGESFLSVLGWSEQAESYRRSWSVKPAAGTPIGVANNDDSDTMTWSQFAPAMFMDIVLLIIISIVGVATGSEFVG